MLANWTRIHTLTCYVLLCAQAGQTPYEAAKSKGHDATAKVFQQPPPRRSTSQTGKGGSESAPPTLPRALPLRTLAQRSLGCIVKEMAEARRPVLLAIMRLLEQAPASSVLLQLLPYCVTAQSLDVLSNTLSVATSSAATTSAEQPTVPVSLLSATARASKDDTSDTDNDDTTTGTSHMECVASGAIHAVLTAADLEAEAVSWTERHAIVAAAAQVLTALSCKHVRTFVAAVDEDPLEASSEHAMPWYMAQQEDNMSQHSSVDTVSSNESPAAAAARKLWSLARDSVPHPSNAHVGGMLRCVVALLTLPLRAFPEDVSLRMGSTGAVALVSCSAIPASEIVVLVSHFASKPASTTSLPSSGTANGEYDDAGLEEEKGTVADGVELAAGARVEANSQRPRSLSVAERWMQLLLEARHEVQVPHARAIDLLEAVVEAARNPSTGVARLLQANVGTVVEAAMADDDQVKAAAASMLAVLNSFDTSEENQLRVTLCGLGHEVRASATGSGAHKAASAPQVTSGADLVSDGGRFAPQTGTPGDNLFDATSNHFEVNGDCEGEGLGKRTHKGEFTKAWHTVQLQAAEMEEVADADVDDEYVDLDLDVRSRFGMLSVEAGVGAARSPDGGAAVVPGMKLVLTPTTCKNLAAVLEAVDSATPLLLQGATGVGKSATIDAAVALRNNDARNSEHIELRRFNMSSKVTYAPAAARIRVGYSTRSEYFLTDILLSVQVTNDDLFGKVVLRVGADGVEEFVFEPGPLTLAGVRYVCVCLCVCVCVCVCWYVSHL